MNLFTDNAIREFGAVLHCYHDKECTEELDRYSQAYSFHLGPEYGFNGTDGDYLVQHIYIRNEGTADANNTRIIEVGDNYNYFRLLVEGSELHSKELNVGTIKIGQVIDLNIYCLIPAKAEPVDLERMNYAILFDSIPDASFDEVYVESKPNTNLELDKYYLIIGNPIKPCYIKEDSPTVCAHKLGTNVFEYANFEDTRNTAGSNDIQSKLFLVGAADNTRDYSITNTKKGLYIGEDNCVYTNNKKVATELPTWSYDAETQTLSFKGVL